MIVELSTGTFEVTGAPPFGRAAVLAAHPLPDPPLIPIRRADGGTDWWPDRDNPEYQARLARAVIERDHALWQYYILVCLPAEPPADDAWRARLEWVGVPLRDNRKLDWVEYKLLATPADVDALRAAFRVANDATAEDREAADRFFDVTWDGEPVRKAGARLKVGKLAYGPGFAQFRAAARWGMLPLSSEELPEALTPDPSLPAVGTVQRSPVSQTHGRGEMLRYYDLPPALRARLEVFCEMELLVEALRLDEAYGGSK